MKIPAQSVQNNQEVIQGAGTLYQKNMILAHVCRPRKRVFKRNKTRKAPMKPILKTQKHFTFSSVNNSKFKPSQSRTKGKNREQAENNNSCSTRQEQSFLSKTSSCITIGSSEKPSMIPKEINPHFQDIFKNMISRQSIYIPKLILSEEQNSEITRNILANWILQACSNFNFKTQTFFLAVNIMDRVLGLTSVRVEQMACLGITTIFMASKYEQIMTYKLKNLTATVPSDQKVSVDQVLSFENQILALLGFDLSYQSPVIFIECLISKLGLTQSIKDQTLKIASQLICAPHWRYRSTSFIALESLKIAVKKQLCGNYEGRMMIQHKVQILEEYLISVQHHCSSMNSQII